LDGARTQSRPPHEDPGSGRSGFGHRLQKDENAIALGLLVKAKVTGSYEWEWYVVKK
jgi:hypothetical protein